MGTRKYTTTVQNHGNINKGGSKIINSYRDGSLVSTRTMRGSPGNKSGGANNTYTSSVYTIDRPSSSSSSSRSSVRQQQRPSSGSSSNVGDIIILAILAAIVAAIGAVFFGVFKLGKHLYGKFTHNTKDGIMVSTKEQNELSIQSLAICNEETRRTGT